MAYHMESLESKLDRLSPEQRREVEDFVDFILQKSKTPLPAPLAPQAAPPPLAAASVPFFEQEPASIPEPVKLHDLIRRKEPPAASPQEDVASLVQEISISDDDSLSGNYMDYGQFEPAPPSPATEAVKRVKEKIREKKEHDPATHLLEWID
jgi:hypothetical protein